MRCAVIDIGTNSILLLIAEMKSGGGLHVIHDESRITRLGAGIKINNIISGYGVERAVEAINKYIETCKLKDVQKIYLIGTAVFRYARNAAEVIYLIYCAAGYTVTVLSGEEEALYSFISAIPENAPDGRRFLVIDVGGGSSEVVCGSRNSIEFEKSIPAGAVTLFERIVKHDPPVPDEMAMLNTEIKSLFAELPSLTGNFTAVAIGGTATTLAAIHHKLPVFDRMKVDGTVLTVDDIKSIMSLFLSMPVVKRAGIPGMECGREDIILAGTAILQNFLSTFKLSKLTVSAQGVRYGYLLAHINDEE